jgi:hypothetical protein
MVNIDYTDNEDVAVDEEAIEFINCDNNNQDNGNDNGCNNDDDNDDNNGNDDDNGDDLHRKVATTKKRKKGVRSKLMTLKKRKSKKTNKHNASINHDFVVSGEGDADVEGDAGSKDSDDDVDLFKEKRYEKTKAKKCTMHNNGQPGREIHLIPFTRTSEFFCPNMSDEEHQK